MKTPDHERILRSLKAAGSRGVASSDWSQEGRTPDGGPPIKNFAGRLFELRHEHGHTIEPTDERRNRCRCYRLVEPPQAEPVMGVAEFEALSLAALAPAPRSAIFDEDNAA